MTAEALNAIYGALLREYYGDVSTTTRWRAVTWARIPHFFSTPYYVYQYATCFATTARLMQDIRSSDDAGAPPTGWSGICRSCAPAAATTR